MVVLGIESSHDDTSIALVQNHVVLFNYQISQVSVHEQYGGTIPEIASREHYHNFYILLEQILTHHADQLDTIDYIAYTREPGLIGALQMGQVFAHALAKALNKPLKPINHLDGHIFSVLLRTAAEPVKMIKYPALALVVSGGHTNLYYIESPHQRQLIGQTLDDAAGEVFDKVARTLNMGFPGGAKIDRLFEQRHGTAQLGAIKFTSPKLQTPLNFSFSGFKTQVINLARRLPAEQFPLIAVAFQRDVVNYIVNTVQHALAKYKVKSLILSGGVSANNHLRNQLGALSVNVLLPKMDYTTDNGAMIAAACIEQTAK